MQTKVCTQCGVEKGLEGFYKSKSGKYGVRPNCKDCHREQTKKHYKENPEYFKKYREKYYKENPEYFKEYREENREMLVKHSKKFREENREVIAKYNKKYYKENREVIAKYREKHREKYREYFKKYYEENQEVYKAHSAKRRARKRNATPDWLTPLDFLVIRHMYETCPEGYHVDHIVPLKGKTVSGLHVPWNLQHLPAVENISKGNREWPDMWLLEEAA